MPEEKKRTSWKERFLANRMTFESILFEKELVVPRREKLSVGLLWSAGIWLFGALMLAHWVLGQGAFFTADDAEGFARIKSYLSHLSSGGFWSLFKPVVEGFGPEPNPPLYYLTYFPVFRFLTGDLSAALLLVNSFYLLIIALAVFLTVKKSRNNLSGWLGTAFVFGMPFTIETARHPQPELAAMAMAAAAYCCYVNSEDFELPAWSFWFSVFFSLGFFSHRHFWVFALPLVPFVIPAITGYVSGGEILKGLLPGLALNLPWYAMFLYCSFMGFYGPVHQGGGFWRYLGMGARAASLPFFVTGGLALLWMYFSVFMPYSNKKIIAAWFWVPYLALTFLVKSAEPKFFYAALFPLAVATAVMTPNFIRRYFLLAALALMLLNQSGMVPPMLLGRYPLAGGAAPAEYDARAGEILRELSPSASGETRVLVAGGDAAFSAGSFRFFSRARGAAGGVSFYGPADIEPAFADYIVFKTAYDGGAPSETDSFSSAFSRPWFKLLFEVKSEFPMNDGSRTVVYAKRRLKDRPFAEGTYTVKKYSVGALNLENAELKLENFDPQKGVYAHAGVFVPYASYEGADIYGLTLDISGLRLAASGPEIADLLVAGVDSVRVVSAKISAYAVGRFLAERFKFMRDPELKFGEKITLRSETPREITADFSLPVKRRASVDMRLESVACEGYGVPEFLARSFLFSYDLSLNPYRLEFENIRPKGALLEIN